MGGSSVQGGGPSYRQQEGARISRKEGIRGTKLGHTARRQYTIDETDK